MEALGMIDDVGRQGAGEARPGAREEQPADAEEPLDISFDVVGRQKIGKWRSEAGKERSVAREVVSGHLTSPP